MICKDKSPATILIPKPKMLLRFTCLIALAVAVGLMPQESFPMTEQLSSSELQRQMRTVQPRFVFGRVLCSQKPNVCKDGARCVHGVFKRECVCTKRRRKYNFEKQKCVKDSSWCRNSADCEAPLVCCYLTPCDVAYKQSCLDPKSCMALFGCGGPGRIMNNSNYTIN